VTDLPPIFALDAYLLPTVWGGEALQRDYGKAHPAASPLGESWEASCVEGRESGIVGGPSLARAFAENPRRFLRDPKPAAPFPLLVKLLATSRLLSVQVHPNDAAAARFEGSPYGKREAWVVLSAAPDAEIYLGLRDGVTTEDLCAAAAAGDEAKVVACLRRLKPKVGDVFDITPGTVHAPGAGLVLYEVQQPVDWTYRLFDWNRKGLDGKPRTLHLEKARAVVDPASRPNPAHPPESDAPIVSTPYFTLRRVAATGEAPLKDGALRVATCVGGVGVAEADGAAPVELRPGTTCVALRDAKNVRLRGEGLDVFVASPADG
jgi:mannose-6-phosphate isomerase class I